MIYKYSPRSNNILFLGDKEIKEYILEGSNSFIYDEISYKELINNIKSNDYIIVKNKEVYLNQLISNADIIVIHAESIGYKNRCYKNDRILSEYEKNIVKDLNNLLTLINKISSAKIIILGNKCNNKNISKDLIDLYKDYNYINIYDKNAKNYLINYINELSN